MEHVVFYPGPDGAPAFRRLASLDEAVRLVEHLRNVEGVTEVSVYALTPVPLSFRPYYRVEVPAEAGSPDPVAEAPVAEAVTAEVPVPAAPVDVPLAPVEPALVDAAVDAPAPSSNGKRTLGFFAH
jgi:hypothetical protein